MGCLTRYNPSRLFELALSLLRWRRLTYCSLLRKTAGSRASYWHSCSRSSAVPFSWCVNLKKCCFSFVSHVFASIYIGINLRKPDDILGAPAPSFIVTTLLHVGLCTCTRATGTSSSVQPFPLKSYCSVEGYQGSLDRAHDVLTDICDDHVIWWPRREWTEWIPKLVWIVMIHNDLCTCIALTKWDGPVACVLRHRKCWKFWK